MNDLNENLTELKPFIEVTGKSEIEVDPDEIYIRIIVAERYIMRTKVTIEEQEEILKNALEQIGFDLANLSLSNANADYVKVSWTKKDVLTTRDYTLKVSNAKTLGQVFNLLEKLEITDASIYKVSHSKMENLKKEVNIMAVKTAKDKAEYLLAAIGEQIGRPLEIKENEQTIRHLPIHDMPSMPMFNVSSNSNGRNPDNSNKHDNEIQFQKIVLNSRIRVKFSIK